jgi:hypothetical protein
MITSKVHEIIEVREWKGGHGTVFFHKLKMDNGDIGEIGKKVDNAFRVGDELTYEIEPTQFGNKFKVPQPAFGGGNGFGGAKKGSTASFALSYAKDLAVANIAVNNAPIEMASLATKIIATATTFQNWLKENE